MKTIKGFENEDVVVSDFGEWVGKDYIDYKGEYENNKKIIKMLVAENQELKEKLDKSIQQLLKENQELKKQFEEVFDENRRFRKELENCMTFEEYEYTLNKKIQLENQQKEFIKYLEDEIHSCEAVSALLFNSSKEMKVYKEILQKYKEIIGDDK